MDETQPAARLDSFQTRSVAVVFGASGGIGRALNQALLESQRFDHVVAFSRTTPVAIDLLDEASLECAAAHAASKGEIRLVIDATGFLHDENQGPEKSLQQIDAAKMARAFALNAIGPALIMKHVLPLMPRNGKSVFATLSARVASIGDNRLGGWYSYRASKAALNQLVRTAAVELARRAPSAICIALHPGTVETGLSTPFQKGGLQVQSPQTAALRMLEVIDGLGPDHSGAFLDHLGAIIPW